jgi:catechol 2,3-dioxygenase-like lactoylglutathione lyase family enzyme
LQVRFARHTSRLEEVVRFYRDGLGLAELGRFEDHDGYDGVFLDLPGTNAHLEFTRGGAHPPPDAHEETLLVLFLGDEAMVAETCGRVDAQPIEPANPYWRSNGVTVLDPDGFPVVLVPTLYSAPADDCPS